MRQSIIWIVLSTIKNLYKADAVTTEDGTQIGLLWPKDSSGNWMSADPERYGDNGTVSGNTVAVYMVGYL